jgi:hypothetical protein
MVTMVFATWIVAAVVRLATLCRAENAPIPANRVTKLASALLSRNLKERAVSERCPKCGISFAAIPGRSLVNREVCSNCCAKAFRAELAATKEQETELRKSLKAERDKVSNLNHEVLEGHKEVKQLHNALDIAAKEKATAGEYDCCPADVGDCVLGDYKKCPSQDIGQARKCWKDKWLKEALDQKGD